MNPFHFITHQAAQDVEASLAGKREVHLPLRRKARNRGEHFGVAKGVRWPRSSSASSLAFVET
jgi:hypothetical protein